MNRRQYSPGRAVFYDGDSPAKCEGTVISYHNGIFDIQPLDRNEAPVLRRLAQVSVVRLRHRCKQSPFDNIALTEADVRQKLHEDPFWAAFLLLKELRRFRESLNGSCVLTLDTKNGRKANDYNLAWSKRIGRRFATHLAAAAILRYRAREVLQKRRSRVSGKAGEATSRASSRAS